MTHLGYMAIICREPERLEQYYQRWFGFEELARADSGTIYLTDGAITMGLLPRGAANGEDDQTLGLHHVGFVVESVAEVERRLREYDPAQRLEKRPATDPYAEYRMVDPDGI